MRLFIIFAAIVFITIRIPSKVQSQQQNQISPHRAWKHIEWIELMHDYKLDRSELFRPGRSVVRVVYTPDAKYLASISRYGYLRLWDIATGKLCWRLKMDNVDSKTVLSVSRDGKKLAVLTNTNYAAVSTEGKELLRHQWPAVDFDSKSNFRCLAISPNQTAFARESSDGTICLNDALTGQEKLRISVGERSKDEALVAIEFSADGEKIYVMGNKKSGVMVFDVKTGKIKANLDIPPKAFAHPSALVVSQKLNLLAAMEPLVLWDLAGGMQRSVIWSSIPPRFLKCGAFSPDGRIFAVGGGLLDNYIRPIAVGGGLLNNYIVLFDTATGRAQQCLNVQNRKAQTLMFEDTTQCLLFAPDGKTLVAGDNSGCLTLWDVTTGKPVPPSPFTDIDKEVTDKEVTDKEVSEMRRNEELIRLRIWLEEKRGPRPYESGDAIIDLKNPKSKD